MRDFAGKLLRAVGLCRKRELDCAQMAVAQMREEIKKLHGHLQTADRTIMHLTALTEDCRGRFAEILALSDENLAASSKYAVNKNESGPGWTVTTEHCQLGGCDVGIYAFHSERDALIFTALLDTVGFKPPRNTACAACYTEYMRGCV